MYYRSLVFTSILVFLLISACSNNSPNDPLSGNNASSKIVFHWLTAKSDGLYMIDPVNGGISELAAGSAPACSFDGQQIAFSSPVNDKSNIMLINSDGSGMRTLYSTEGDYTDLREPVWSPDNSRIAFRMSRDGYTGIVLIKSDGTDIINIDTGYNQNGRLRWSPAGSSFTLTCSDLGVGEYNIFKIDLGIDPVSLDMVKLITGTTQFSYPSWSYDGSKIVYCTDGKIYRMNADGTGVAYLTDGTYPLFAPDRNKVVYISGTGFDKRLYLMESDGASQTELAQIDEVPYMPKWSPDGRYIAFIGARIESGGMVVSSNLFAIDVIEGTINELLPESGIVQSFSWSPPLVEKNYYTY